MKLPEKFQMRLSAAPGFTHTVKRNSHGDYEVNWARGYPHTLAGLPRKVWYEEEVWDAVQSVWWVVVDDKPKQEDVLPDEFYFLNSLDQHFKAQRQQSYWLLTSQEDGRTVSVSEDQVKSALKTSWKIIAKPTLTTEQQRQVKEFREQLAQLDSSIKLNEQDIEHKLRLISNYEARQKDLLDMIAKLEGNV